MEAEALFQFRQRFRRGYPWGAKWVPRFVSVPPTKKKNEKEEQQTKQEGTPLASGGVVPAAEAPGGRPLQGRGGLELRPGAAGRRARGGRIREPILERNLGCWWLPFAQVFFLFFSSFFPPPPRVFYVVSPVGLKGNLSLLEIFLFLPGVLTNWKVDTSGGCPEVKPTSLWWSKIVGNGSQNGLP